MTPASQHLPAALAGLRVVELEATIAVAVAGMLLADLGAEVLKIEGPDGDPSRQHPGSAAWNRSKASRVLIERTPETLRRELSNIDVILTPTLSMAGFRAEDLQEFLAQHPRLVLGCGSPTGDLQPWLNGKESHGLLAAYMGISRRQSSFGGGPVELVGSMLLYLQGAWLAATVLAALVERQASARGQIVEVSGLQATLHAAAGILSVDPELADPNTAVGPAGRHPTYTRYQARDGEWLVVGALGSKFERALLASLGLTGLLHDPRLADNTANLVAPDNLQWVQGEIREAFLSQPAARWVEDFRRLGIPCGEVLGRDDWLDHEQVRAAGLRLVLVDPQLGECVVPGRPVTLSRTPGPAPTPAPAIGDDRGVAPSSFVARKQVEGEGRPRLVPGPLHGITVLNVGTFVATPFAGCLLAELGADVIKVEPLGGDPWRAGGFIYNKGMRSVAVDLKARRGREIMGELLVRADGIITGLRPGVASDLGLDRFTALSINPDLVHVSLSAFGEGGPLGGLPGVDMALQGMSGMMRAQGGDDEPVALTMPIIDVTTSVLIAYGTIAALYAGRAGSGGQAVEATLLGTSTFLQLGELTSTPARASPEVGGRDYIGRDLFDRLYETSDGWIRVERSGPVDPTAEELLAVGLKISSELLVQSPEAAMASALAVMTVASAVSALRKLGVPAVEARQINDVIRDPDLISRDLLFVRAASDGRTFVTGGRSATFSRTRRIGPLRSPGVGEHSRQVLYDAGCTPQTVDELVALGVVQEGLSQPQQLPPVYR